MEDFIPGREFALEGLVTAGRLQTLALFDKPDPLDGPFFEETIYVTPSREPAAVQSAILETAQRAVAALGCTYGPVHAEMRVNERGVWMLEVAARPIGGLCSRVLRFERRRIPGRTDPAPRPGRGCFAIPPGARRARRHDDSHSPRRRLSPALRAWTRAPDAGIEDVVITAKEGQMLVPLPEGASYLGFIFARGAHSGLRRSRFARGAFATGFSTCRWRCPS